MAKGTKIPSPAVYAYVFDCSVPDFIDPAEYVAAVTTSGTAGEDTRDKL
jgi:hypothetical protein